jgi:hypothetical protein
LHFISYNKTNGFVQHTRIICKNWYKCFIMFLSELLFFMEGIQYDNWQESNVDSIKFDFII